MTDDLIPEQQALLNVPHDWEKDIKGIIDYAHQDMMPDSTMLVHFRNAVDRQAFSELVNQQFSPRTKFIWYPEAKIGVAADKVWVSALDLQPRYPIYIISKGRADTRLTSRALEWLKVPYHIVVEPQEYDQYAAVINPEKILTLPFSNLGQGSIPARNWCWEHAISIGAKRHWILDDNISGFCRFHENMKIEFATPAPFCMVEDFSDRYENLVMSGFNYDYFAPRKAGAKISPITWNTRIYSGILLRNDITALDGAPIRWRGRYNEDTDLSLRILKDGLTPSTPGRYSTALFNALLMYKKPTLKMKGGNATELYQGVEAAQEEWEAHAAECGICKNCTDGYGERQHPCPEGCAILEKDGRWRMAESLHQQHPDCTTVERKWGRWQHQVDYRAFRDNPRVITQSEKEERDWQLSLIQKPAGWGDMQGNVRMRGAYMQRAQKPKKFNIEKKPEPIVVPPTVVSISDFLKSLKEQPIAELAAQPLPVVPSAAMQPEVASLGPPAEPAPTSVPAVESGPSGWGLTEPGPDAVPAFASDLARRGHRLLTRDGKFFVSESSRLTDEDRAYIKANREALIQLATPWTEPSDLPPIIQSPVSDPPPSSPPVDSAVPEGSLFSTDAAPMSLAQFLGAEPPRIDPNYKLEDPPDLSGINEIVLNFATSGLNWREGHKPVGVTVSTMDGELTRFLPFAFEGGGNHDEATIKRWFVEQVRDKKITNANTRFDVHMAREWGVDLEEQGCTFSDIMHTAALLDDHRKRFALDVLIEDYLPGERKVERVDERVHSTYAASEVAEREHYSARMVAKLVERLYPEMEKQELMDVQRLEDAVIPAVVEMEKNGFPLDMDLLSAMHAECMRRHDDIMIEIGREAGFAFEHSASGWKKLFEKLGLPPSDSYAEDVMGEIEHPLVKKAYFASQLASLNSKTFAAYKKIATNGVLYYDINQLRGDDGGTVSGRFSIGYVQQVPNHDGHHKVFGEGLADTCKTGLCHLFPRRLFVAGYGDVLDADAAQIEYRFFAHFANNPSVLEAYRQNPHMSFHKEMWTRFKVYKPDMAYTDQKTLNFAKQYGAKMVKLAVMMGFISKAEGEEIRRAKRWDDPRLERIKEIEAVYRKVMPEAEELLDRASHLAKSKCDDYCKQGDKLHRLYEHRGYVKTIVGRRSRFPHNNKTYIGLNRVIQGSGADVMKTKLVELHKQRKQTGFLMRLTVHDSVLGDTGSRETTEKVGQILNHQSFPQVKVPILWETKSGRNWAECK